MLFIILVKIALIALRFLLLVHLVAYADQLKSNSHINSFIQTYKSTIKNIALFFVKHIMNFLEKNDSTISYIATTLTNFVRWFKSFFFKSHTTSNEKTQGNEVRANDMKNNTFEGAIIAEDSNASVNNNTSNDEKTMSF